MHNAFNNKYRNISLWCAIYYLPAGWQLGSNSICLNAFHRFFQHFLWGEAILIRGNRSLSVKIAISTSVLQMYSFAYCRKI